MQHRDERLAVVYARVSTETQERDGASLGQQERQLRHYAARSGLEVVAVIRDTVSGTVPFDQREGGREVLRLLEEFSAGNVLALALDRLSRDQLDGVGLVRGWGRAGVAVHLPNDGGVVDNESASGRASTGMRSVMAAWWRDVIAERTKLALRHKIESGQAVGRAPTGFRIVRDERDARVTRLVPIPGHPALEAHRRARELRAAGLTLASIAAQLNLERAADGRRFHATTVRRMLSNPAVSAHVAA